jgi:hypothetical protein
MRYSLRATIMQKALDLASAVATHLDAVGTASRQAGSPAQSVNILFQVCLPPVAGSALEPRLAHSYKGASPLVKSHEGAHPLRNSQAGQHPASRLRASVSRGDCVISRQTVINNAG